MEDLSRIKAKLENLGELGELVGALRSMAGMRAREAQEAFAGTRTYREVIERAISEVFLLVPGDGAHAAWQRSNGSVLLVLTSENGFVGGFNTRIMDRAVETLKPTERCVVIGRRGQILAAEHGIADVTGFPMTSRVQGVTALARRVAAGLKGIASARLVHARHRPGAAFEVHTRTVLPFARVSRPDGRSPPVVQNPPMRLLADLAFEYLFAEIAHALMESLASENAARMRAMDAASNNIDAQLETLRRDERVARQERTTTELLDVVTGAEAVNGD